MLDAKIPSGLFMAVTADPCLVLLPARRGGRAGLVFP